MESQRKEPNAKTKPTVLEWQVCEDEREWQQESSAQNAPFAPQLSPSRWNARSVMQWALSGMLLLLTVALSGGWWLWHNAQEGLAEIQSELESAVAADLWSATHPLPLRTSTPTQSLESALLQEGNGQDEEVTGVEIRKIGSDWAVVRVLIRQQPTRATYRQTQAYHYSDFSWKRSEVAVAYWGEARQFETEYFIFQYHSLDHEAVTAAATQIDTLYRNLYNSYFSDEPNDKKVVVVVNPEWVREVQAHQTRPSGTIIIGSPAAILIPAEITEGDSLLQAVVLQLLDRLSRRATDENDLPSHWYSLRDGLRLWLLWEQELPLALWRQPVVRWVFWEPLSEVTSEGASFSKFANALCDNHSLWMTSPLEAGIPLVCLPQNRNGEMGEILGWRIATSEPIQVPLPALLFEQSQPRYLAALSTETKADTVVLATVVEYVVATFGRERLPTLLAALPAHESWDTLISAVFGISVKEFEEGWHGFLAEEYGIGE